MRKSIALIFILVILNGCAEYATLVGPSYTMAKTGSIVNTTGTMAATYGFKKTTGKSPGEYINSFAKNYDEGNPYSNNENQIRECRTMHTTNLNKIFFETLDEIDCFRDPFSILR